MSLRRMIFGLRLPSPRSGVRVLSAVIAAGLLLSTAGCSSQTTKPEETNGDPAPAALGTVAMFTPSDGITLSQHTPLNKWAKLVPDITKALEAQGFNADSISSTTSDSLDQQSRDIQDYVVDHAVSQANSPDLSDSSAGSNNTHSNNSAHSDSDDSGDASSADSNKNSAKNSAQSASSITLLVAPITVSDTSTRQYGDYVTQSIGTNSSDTGNVSSDSTSGTAADTSADDSAASNDSVASSQPSDDTSGSNSDTTVSHSDSDSETASSSSADSSDTASSSDLDSTTLTDADDTAAMARLVSALELAKNSGMHVILMANTLDGFTPDAFVEFSTAERIGEIQAQKLADKLQLSKTSKDNPKAIEVLLPYTTTDADGNLVDSTFAKEAFQGVWKVLGPYFEQGKAFSPSGLLTAATTDGDWEIVAFEINKDSQIKEEFSARLRMDDSSANAYTRIDGVIAMNDYVASGVVEALSDLGYTGSAADVNPSITISGIVGNITGKHDLPKQKVPDPAQSADNDLGSSDNSNEDDVDENSQWPIVTGYGAYIDEIPQIVNGHQWMTAIEDRKTLATDISDVCFDLDQKDSIAKHEFVSRVTINGSKVPTISENLLAVSASNLKVELIDPGYISLADAGL